MFSDRTAMPGPPAFMQRPRHRRKDDARVWKSVIGFESWHAVVKLRYNTIGLLVLYLGITFLDLL